MLALISSIIASIQLNLAIIDIQENYKRRLNQAKLSALVLSLFSFGFLPADFDIFLLSCSQQTHVVT